MSHKWKHIIQSVQPANGRKSVILSGAAARDGGRGVAFSLEDVPWWYWDWATWHPWKLISSYYSNESATIELVKQLCHIIIVNSRQQTRTQTHPRWGHVTQDGVCGAVSEDVNWGNRILLLTSAYQPPFFIPIYLSHTLLPGKSASVLVAIMLREHFKQAEVVAVLESNKIEPQSITSSRISFLSYPLALLTCFHSRVIYLQYFTHWSCIIEEAGLD